jgi:hypothetical protein
MLSPENGREFFFKTGNGDYEILAYILFGQARTERKPAFTWGAAKLLGKLRLDFRPRISVVFSA